MAIPTGEVYLLSNVPLVANYEHTIDFKDKEEQFSYFRGFITHNLGENYSYIRKEREYITVGLPMLDLEDVNYLIFRSVEGERLYYGFITNKIYINNSTTQIAYTLDVLQTYMFDYKWRPTYIKQAHVDRWNAEHKPIYSKTEESLDYGTEYAIESAYKLKQSENLKWLLVTTTSYSALAESGHVTEGGTIYPAPPPFATLLIPVPLKIKSSGSEYDVTWNKGIAGVSNIATYNEFIKLMLKTSFGDIVQSVSLMTYNPFISTESVDSSGENIAITFSSAVDVETVRFKDSEGQFIVLKQVGQGYLVGSHTLAVTDWNTGLDSLPTEKEWEEIKAKPYTTKRDKRWESKLLCAPYRYNLLTDWRNTPIVFKNEYMTTDKIKVMFSYALSANVPFRFWIKDYKKDPEGRYTSLLQPIALEFPIVSDAYYRYMLENKNTIQANLTNATINAVAGTVNGAISGGGMGGAAGAIYGAVSGGVAGALNVAAQVRSENAKQADLRAKPDSVIASTDSSFNILDQNTDISFYRMRICCENEEIIAELFNMQGYRVNRVEIPNLRSRTRFNYIQTIGANIVGSINQNDLLKIKEIYDRGVTIWHYQKDHFNPLDYSYENIEVNLI